MIRIIFTLDYEIHGNGDGCPHELMIEPTYRLLNLCDEYQAKMTIMADVGEILKFKEYKDKYGRDDYGYDEIVNQLQYAIKKGHDVQLHIHSSYFNARHDNGSWIQDWSEYNFASLQYERMNWMIGVCKKFLEALLRPINPNYRCIAFRATNWSVNPSKNVVRALVNNGIKFDTSIFKYGRRDGTVSFDYSRAYSQLVPWRVKEDDICDRDDTSCLWEVPIYSEKRWIGAFLTYNRIYRIITSWSHKVEGVRSLPRNGTEDGALYTLIWPLLSNILKRQAWKADFNQCGSKQLINALHRAAERYDRRKDMLFPFVLIGHSKLFTKLNERSLRRFLEHSAKHPDKFGFGTLSGINRSWKP